MLPGLYCVARGHAPTLRCFEDGCFCSERISWWAYWCRDPRAAVRKRARVMLGDHPGDLRDPDSRRPKRQTVDRE